MKTAPPGGMMMCKVPPEVFRGFGPLVRQRTYTNPSSVVRWLFWRRLERLLLLPGKRSFNRVLDCGCGEGALLPTLSNRFSEVCALDQEVQGALRLVRQMNLPNVRLMRGDIYRLPYSDRTFDLVVTADVLEHLENLHGALSEIHRVLKPGGTLLASFPSENAMYQAGRWLFGFTKPRDHYHEPRAIERRLGERFRIVRRRRFPINLLDGIAVFILVQAAAMPMEGA